MRAAGPQREGGRKETARRRERSDSRGEKKKKKKRVPSGPSSWGKFTGAGRDRHGKNDGPPDFAFHGEICTAGVGVSGCGQKHPRERRPARSAAARWKFFRFFKKAQVRAAGPQREGGRKETASRRERSDSRGKKKKKKKRVPSGPSSWGKFTGAGRDRHGKNDGPPDFAFHGEICTAGVGVSGCGQNTPGRDGPPGRRRHGGSFFDFSRRPKCGRRGHSEKAAVRRRQVAERDPTAGGKKKKKKKRVPSGPSSWGKFTGAGRDRHGKNDGPPDFAFHGEICTAGVGVSGCGQNTAGRDGPPGRRRHGGSFFEFSRRPKCGRRGHSEKAAVRETARRRERSDRQKKKKKKGGAEWP